MPVRFFSSSLLKMPQAQTLGACPPLLADHQNLKEASLDIPQVPKTEAPLKGEEALENYCMCQGRLVVFKVQGDCCQKLRAVEAPGFYIPR